MSITKYDKPAAQEGYYTIGQIAKMYHLGADSLRYYEERGILQPTRGDNGYRLYSPKDIWRLNVILDLRRLGFPVEQIYQYFQNRTLDATVELLGEELRLIEEKQRQLRAMKKTVQEELQTITEARALPLGEIQIKKIDPRPAYIIERDYSEDEEMDILMKDLIQLSGQNQLIGNNRIASVLAPENVPTKYTAAILFDAKGDGVVPGGEYLSICYRGVWNSRENAALLRHYAEEHGIRLSGYVIDIIWIDIHTAEPMEEHISEVQALIAED